jgi:Lar family restriction alleviation protein
MSDQAMLRFDAPENCIDCKLSISTDHDPRIGQDLVYCEPVKELVKNFKTKRHPDCPLEIVTETPEGELKPCPFCGEDAEIVSYPGLRIEGKTEFYMAICNQCNARILGHPEVKAAIAAWNKRE